MCALSSERAIACTACSTGPGAASAARPAVRPRWRLVRAARLSVLGKRRGGSGAPGPGLSDPAAQRPSFRPDVPGRYTLRLTARGRSIRTRSRSRLFRPRRWSRSRPWLTHPGPEGFDPVPIGIRVGTKCSTDDKKGIVSVDSGCEYLTTFFKDDWLQVLVLDRETLGFVSNKTYTCSSYPFNCGSQVAGDLKKLDDTKLVIAVSQPGFTHPYDLQAALGSIGFPNLSAEQKFALSNAPGGVVSVIGVPGLRAGQAHARIVPDGEAGAGEMNGYLTPDQYFNFTWLPMERVPFDTRAPGFPETQNVIVVGTQIFRGDITGPTSNYAGFQVVVLDGHTLDQRAAQVFVTSALHDDAVNPTINQMADFLGSEVRPGDVVLISSTRRYPLQELLANLADPAAKSKLASAIASVGGTRDAFNRCAGDFHCQGYALVGWGGAGEGNGQETSTQKDPSTGDARIRGVLAPDRLSLFKPVTASALDEPPEALAGLMVQAPGKEEWPLDGDPGAQKAIAYIGSHHDRLGQDPRSAYWTQPFDQATWSAIARQVHDLDYPGAGNGFSEDEFKSARNELVQEITWVGDVRAYLKDLSSPFADTGITSWANLTTITDKVKDALKPPDQRMQMLVLDVVGGVLSIGGVAGGPVVEFVSVAYETTLQYLTQDRDGGDAETITGNANELAARLVSSLQDARAGFRNLGNIIVSDYDKLKTVGTLGGCSSTSANCPPEWQFSQRDQQQASAATYKSIESEFSQELMRLAFPAYTLNPRGNHRAPNGQVSNDAKDFPCFGRGVLPAFYPFRNEPDNGQVALLQELHGKPTPAANFTSERYDVLALGNLSDLSIIPINLDPNMPPRAVLGRMFGPLDKTLDPKAGGLGINKADFMISANRGDYDNATKEKLGNPVGCGTGNWPG